MRKLLIVGALMMGLLWAAPAGAQPGAAVSVESVKAEAGNIVTVNVEAHSVLGLSVVTAEVWYDSAVVRATSCQTDPDGVLSLGLCNPGYNRNAVKFAVLDVSGVSGNVTLATLTLEVQPVHPKTTAALEIVVRTFADADGEPLAVREHDGVVRVD